MNFLTLAMALIISTHAWAGTETNSGNGGGADELEFTSIGMKAASILNKWDSTRIPEVTSAQLKAAVTETTVRMVDGPLFQGNPKRRVDAKNNPEKMLIRVDRACWKALEGTSDKRLGLVLHEYLGILGVETDSYAISAKFIHFLTEDALHENASGESMADWYTNRAAELGGAVGTLQSLSRCYFYTDNPSVACIAKTLNSIRSQVRNATWKYGATLLTPLNAIAECGDSFDGGTINCRERGIESAKHIYNVVIEEMKRKAIVAAGR